MAAHALSIAYMQANDTLRHVAAQVDAVALLELVERTAPKRLRDRCIVQNTGGAREFFLDGRDGEALVRWLETSAPAQASALHTFVATYEQYAREALLSMGWSETEAPRAVFATRSLLCRDSSGAALGTNRAAQPPHVDAMYGSAQFLVALTPAASTLYYGSPQVAPALREHASTLSPHARLEAAMLPLALPRRALEGEMRPIVPDTLAPGDMIAMSGPIIHAGPARAAGAPARIVFFMTCSLADAEPYDRDRQVLPFNYCDEHNDYDGFVRACVEWASHEPWMHYWKTPRFSRAVETLCKTGVAPRKLRDMFDDESAR